MIPNILWQTWKTKEVPESVKTQADSWKQSNPQLELRLCDDEECSTFIREHFGEKIHLLYTALPQPIMRADFWRVAVVYVYGGYYADLDITCKQHISKFIPETVDSCFVTENQSVANFFFGATPKHPAIGLALENMIRESKQIVDKDTQNFGMHSLHQAVVDHYDVVDQSYPNNKDVCTLSNTQLNRNGILIHSVASLNGGPQYDSWRSSVAVMDQERKLCDDILFFTTFNRNGYELYGKDWISSFIKTANYYNKVRARIYYEGFVPEIQHPSIEWVKYEEAVPFHSKWKKEYLASTTHNDYVRTMTVRFSHKAFVIQHALDQNNDGYLIWLDGDCVFKSADYSMFPSEVMEDRFLACQVEHNKELNHIESGILIFNGRHPDTLAFNREFKTQYQVKNVLSMSQPYDGFIIFKSLLAMEASYVDLNDGYGKGGIQSDPTMTFCHPAIKSKFIHNIGWTGKTQYSEWNSIHVRDDIYRKMKSVLFRDILDEEMNKKKEVIMNKLQKLRRLRPTQVYQP